MGDLEPNRSLRLLGALTAAAAVGGLLTSCAGLTGAGAEEPSASTPVVELSTPAPDPSTSAPAPEQTVPAPSESAAKGDVEPFVTSASWTGEGLDVGAVVPKVVESDGTCTASATRDGVTVEASGAAVAASSYTGCPQLLLQDERLTAGAWTITVAYSSGESAGTSAARTVTIG